ncbi:hypothetical protein GGTG_11076 [Gaeumannomyces tritici R3-111a-1]|uniref:Uncharacterized protein n=1 Tax=Gaeumannomyces tritici (strain R3-111a-1) TaxID=644352 RepID=J3PC53_GAET3|nr:hypothetical protein GGTG_11076 [Gaeumannomyces tritici R3-111a-1]EJT71823.1 hypothetical protein GGTG_11076 [Gaeumannomyces tritici R3-111a-1]
MPGPDVDTSLICIQYCLAAGPDRVSLPAIRQLLVRGRCRARGRPTAAVGVGAVCPRPNWHDGGGPRNRDDVAIAAAVLGHQRTGQAHKQQTHGQQA